MSFCTRRCVLQDFHNTEIFCHTTLYTTIFNTGLSMKWSFLLPSRSSSSSSFLSFFPSFSFCVPDSFPSNSAPLLLPADTNRLSFKEYGEEAVVCSCIDAGMGTIQHSLSRTHSHSHTHTHKEIHTFSHISARALKYALTHFSLLARGAVWRRGSGPTRAPFYRFLRESVLRLAGTLQ